MFNSHKRFDNQRLEKYTEIFMLILAVLAIGMLTAESFFNLSAKTEKLFSNIDFFICIVFALEFCSRLAHVKRGERLAYISNNLLDIMAFIPFDKAFRLFRIARVSRLLTLSQFFYITRAFRVARIFIFIRRSIKGFHRFIQTNGLNYMLIFTVIVIFLGAAGVHKFENRSFEDALWWSLVTATTVGYGDIAPKTIEGRMIAALIMVVGISLIGMITSTLSTFFLNEERRKGGNSNLKFVIEQLNNLEDLSVKEIKELKRIIDAYLEMRVSSPNEEEE
ncbi:voltage-gated potassium channel [Orenia metallireducens]|uniref:Voltage-gated potassium channel n=1 Tax=Orenia metallireducens TaxID=1413210 RepID=A0A285HUS2_9FIRM|nr:potassium channel family protein [Orenia metallireducens]PRX30992.1 voltage-gated potassium channel [Orenia metallireducens]SNY39429.1 voltage-gated potassium channel [Orenia metallireducens]